MAPISNTSEENSNEINDDAGKNYEMEYSADIAIKEDKLTNCSENCKSKELNDDDEEMDKMLKDSDNAVTLEEMEAPDGGWGWFIVIGALLLRTVIGGLGRSHGLFYVKFKERFNGTATSTALVTSLTGFLRLSAGPAVSILSGRFRCRVLTAVGTGVLFLGLIMTGFGPNLQFLYFSYGVVAGLGRAFALTPVPILLGYYFNKRRSLAFGLASAGFSIGGFAITPIVELLFQHFGYQGTFLILSGFALNILVSSALFRPIELHRKFTALNRSNSKKSVDSSDVNSTTFKSLEQIESEAVLNSSTISINRLHVKSNGATSSKLSIDQPKPPLSGKQTSDEKKLRSKKTTWDKDAKTSIDNNNIANENDTEVDSLLSKEHTDPKSKKNTVECHNSVTDQNRKDNSNKKEPLIQSTGEIDANCEESKEESNDRNRFCCFKNRKSKQSNDKKKSKLISWSVLKDTRFQCFVFATFCFTLPSGGLFLPALAKSKGVSELQAATLLSISAGCDTVFRVLSGIVLDLKMFRSSRPLIYNGVTFLQGIVSAFYPLMSTYGEFSTVSAIDGAVQGIKNAQGAVIMMDLLGVDKLASSMAVTMAVQCVAVFLGPTISGQLIDSYGNYDGAFYFGSGAILLGGLVMAGGNIAKHCSDRKSTATQDSDSDISTKHR